VGLGEEGGDELKVRQRERERERERAWWADLY